MNASPLSNGKTASEHPGLTSAEVAARRGQGLTNAVQEKNSRPLRDILKGNFFNPIYVVLYVIGTAMITVGDVRSGVGTVGLLLVNALVGTVQEVTAKRQLEQIARLARTSVLVVRDGREQSIDPDEIVLGDVVVIRPDDQIPVDGKLLNSSNIETDESALTGQSNLVAKTGGDLIWSGSSCITGSGLLEATGVGESSSANTFTQNARRFKRKRTSLERVVSRIVRCLLLIVLVFVLVALLTRLVTDVSLPVWLRALSVVADMVSVGLLTLITLNYSWGAINIGQKGALVQQVNAVEALSNVSVLCCDKTGTLTTNQIVYRDACPVGIERGELEGLLADYAASASRPNKTAQALIDALQGTPRRLADEAPFDSARKWSGMVLDDSPLRGAYVLGAAEMLADQMELTELARLQIERWSKEGLRVLAFGRNSEVMTLHNPAGQPCLPRLTLIGLLCFADEPRPYLAETLAAFRSNGIEMKIISGDNPETVAALARQAGFDGDLKMVSGSDLSAMSDGDFVSAVVEATVFGRVSPQQKEALVAALQQQGRFVAMIGDGMNDVLAIKRADVGIAMESGSTAARAVAAIVLQHDSLEAMPAALTEGQRTVSSIQDVLKVYLVSVFALVLLIIGVAALGLGFPYSPLQGALLSFFSRSVPPAVSSLTARPLRRAENVGRSVARSFMRFTLPAALFVFVFGLLIFVGTYLTTQHYLLNVDVTPRMIAELQQSTNEIYNVGTPEAFVRTSAILGAQTTLTAFLSLSGILLMLFAAPPTRWFAVTAAPRGSPLPIIAAALLFLGFIAVLLVPPVSRTFELVPLPTTAYLVVGLATLVWMLIQREAWRGRWLERLLDLELD